ncbi:hypothetical protein P152DRAFT_435523 [Eremomyces bilateralis CBS 781.70]|uniref:Uncharacterized protein n=1 Tax=Eremomyces bilateralis CBS 781.70 TaxID=1392243 RepID=A0A6G1G5A8_9PEZI|nr:uncharacterized protein P152DRAFT_435523 [Eremomyces bilateralis CBS 781.70]KAF1813080.1 hypothetical protein P152DRAFT_435523 [Eremomyces bilateralis CBS 781.70]
MDIGFHGGDYSGPNQESESLRDRDESSASYFFPTAESEKPNWKPVSMRWQYIAVLTMIALGFAGLQEYLCQLSMQREKTNKGIITFITPDEIPTWLFFTWKYVPTLVLVTYGVGWQITDYEVKRLEPYYQLSKEGGATAAESLNMDYLTFFSYLTPVKAIRHRQWAVLLSSIGYLLASSLVPVLQSASFNLEPRKEDRKEGEPKFVRIDAPWSRAVTAFLIVVALCGTALIFQLRRKSGLQSDPKGIAGVASMATKSHVLNDFHELDTAPNHVIHKRLQHRRYKLYRSCLWQGERVKTETAPPSRLENPHPRMLRLAAGILYIVCLLLFGGLIPALMFVPGANVVTEKLPWFLTLLATLIKLVWTTFDCDVRVIEPYYILSRRQAPGRTLTLDYTGTIPGWIIIKAALNGHILVSVVGLGAIMCEVLTVVVSSFNFNSGETFRSFWGSFALAEFILLSLSVIATLVYVYRRHPFLPRQPGTIASVLAFVHQSKMLDPDFTNTEELNSKEMTEWLERIGKTYGLGWFRGRDKQDHCGVDEEVLDSNYFHGKDRSGTRFTGREDDFNWEVY